MSIKHLYEDERPSLLLDFANSKTLDPRITFERQSVGTYVDEAGIIKTAADNEARFDHNPETGECLGLLIEESRTNILTQSNDFTTWLVYNVTINSNVETAPDGTTTASKMQWSSSSNRNMVFLQPTANVTQTHTCSFFAKAAEWNYAVVAIQPPGGAQPRYWITVDLTTGAIEEYNSGNPLPTAMSASATQLPNGWWRVSATANVNNAGKTQVQMEVGMSPNNTFGSSVSGTPDGTSGIYIWGAQHEQGTFPTSYIPTSGATATRAAEGAQIGGTNFSSWFDNQNGTILLEGELTDNLKQTGQLNQAQHFVNIQAGSGNDRFKIELYQSLVRMDSKSSGATQLFYTFSVPRRKMCLAYSPTEGNAAADGDVGTTQTGKTHTSVPTGCYLGRNSAGNPVTFLMRGHYSKLAFYPTRLSDTTLEALTK